MHLPQSQNKNGNDMCIVGNPVRMIYVSWCMCENRPLVVYLI
jgi:hypothetical protein